MSMRRSFICALVGALAAGCAVGPDYVKPKVAAPDAYRFAEKETAETAATEWWKQFGDPVLDQLIAEALSNNKNAKIAAANVEQAAGVLTQTRSALFPQLSYSASGTRQRSSERAGIPIPERFIQNPQNTYETLAGASWEIDLWGRVRRLTEAARANVFATEQARRGVILSLVSQVASSYLQLRGLDYQLEIAQRSAASYGDTVKLFQLQFQYGVVSQMNVEQARSSYETATAQIPQIETQIVQTENALSILLGRDPGAIPRGKSIQALSMPQIPAGLPSELLARRPDIAQAEQSLIAANAQIGAAKALYFPTISLTGAFGVQSSDLSNLFTGPARVWSYAGKLSGPLFTAGGIKGQVAQASAAQKAALLDYESTIQSAFADVENALVVHQKLIEQQASQERLVRSLREYERLATLQYKGGYTPYSTVLQAQQSLFPQELNLAQTRYNVYNSVVNLYKTMGGGWIEIADQATAAAPPKSEVKTAAASAQAPIAAAVPDDRIEVLRDGEQSVVNVYRQRGAGGAQIRAPKGGWPAAVVVRLHGFPDLASFSAESGTNRLECYGASGARPQCRLGDKRVDALARTGGYFEVKLPPALLAANESPVDVQWAEQGH
jgi:outer membrane protein, multidrug efflux system